MGRFSKVTRTPTVAMAERQSTRRRRSRLTPRETAQSGETTFSSVVRRTFQGRDALKKLGQNDAQENPERLLGCKEHSDTETRAPRTTTAWSHVSSIRVADVDVVEAHCTIYTMSQKNKQRSQPPRSQGKKANSVHAAKSRRRPPTTPSSGQGHAMHSSHTLHHINEQDPCSRRTFKNTFIAAPSPNFLGAATSHLLHVRHSCTRHFQRHSLLRKTPKSQTIATLLSLSARQFLDRS